MYSFKTKYNYFIFVLRLLVTIFLISFSIGFISEQVHSFLTKNFISIMVIVIVIICFAIYLPYRCIRALLKQRNNIMFKDGKIFLRDALAQKEIFIEKPTLKGFSTSIYSTNIWSFKTIIFYFNNGDKLEFPQFIYWNFKDLKPKLIENGISYLGDEPYRWKWFDRRYYMFD